MAAESTPRTPGDEMMDEIRDGWDQPPRTPGLEERLRERVARWRTNAGFDNGTFHDENIFAREVEEAADEISRLRRLVSESEAERYATCGRLNEQVLALTAENRLAAQELLVRGDRIDSLTAERDEHREQRHKAEDLHMQYHAERDALREALANLTQYLERANVILLPDHACAECVPHSDILVSGFRCARHTAFALLNPKGVDHAD